MLINSNKMPYNSTGLIYGRVYHEDGSFLANADDYFYELDGEEIRLWNSIADKLQKHVEKHFPRYKSGKNVWQTGFGGDEGTGLIDYALESSPPMLPNMPFKINNKAYYMTFQ